MVSRSSELVAIPSRGMRECADESATPLAATVHAMRRLSSRNTAEAPEIRPKRLRSSAHCCLRVPRAAFCRVATGHGGPASAAVEGLQGAALLAHAFSARRPRLGKVAHALPTWAWRALSRQVVAQHGVSQLDEQSHARRRCVCARWRREHGSCCLSFEMAAIGDVVARQLVASGRQWL